MNLFRAYCYVVAAFLALLSLALIPVSHTPFEWGFAIGVMILASVCFIIGILEED